MATTMIEDIMTFENITIFVVAILYLSVGISHAFKGNWAWALTWSCYAGSNMGLIFIALKR